MESPTINAPLKGFAVGLFLYDICEEIRLDKLRLILGKQQSGEGGLKHAAAEEIYFERPPVIEQVTAPATATDENLQVKVKFYDYGVLSVLFEFPFAGDWPDLIALSSRLISEINFEKAAQQISNDAAQHAQPALVKPSAHRLSEDYFIFFLREIAGNPTATELLNSCSQQITQVVRGETARLADTERQEVVQGALSYYPNDLAVIGWNAAFIYDSVVGAEAALQLLEYANSQLLEFRYYDDLLTRELASVYDALAKRAIFASRWRLPREASRLQALLLEVTELTERVDNAIKFLSDMFAARLYRLAAAKIGVPDYKNLVEEKLQTAEDLYRFLIDEFHQTRTFILEAMVVIILVVELIYVFRGK